MKYILIILTTFFLSNSLIAQKLDIVEENYYPFNENIKFVFDSNMGETIKSVKKRDSLFLVKNASSKFTYTQSLIEENNGIYLTKTEQNINILFYSKDIEITYSEPILQLPKPVIIGDIWNWSGFQVKNGDTTSISIKGKVLKKEIVEVPAGKFNAIKIRIYFEEVDGERATIYKWLVPNVGVVKTKAMIEGSGVLQIAMSILGYDEIDSELSEIK